MGASVNTLVDELRDAAIALDTAVWESGLQGRFTSTRRSRSEQTRLYRAYISGRHPFPVAPPGSSAHEYGEAFDYLVSPAQYQEDVGLTWASWGGVWGGRKDVVHFELPGASQRALERGRALRPDEPWWYTVGQFFLPATSVDVTQGLDIGQTRNYTDCVLNTTLPASECRKRFSR
jgi:hypothetical protein